MCFPSFVRRFMDKRPKVCEGYGVSSAVRSIMPTPCRHFAVACFARCLTKGRKSGASLHTLSN